MGVTLGTQIAKLPIFLRSYPHQETSGGDSKYRFEGKEKLISLGVYPAVSLKQARARPEEAKQLLDQGINPSDQPRGSILSTESCAANSFEAVSREWFESKKRQYRSIEMQ